MKTVPIFALGSSIGIIAAFAAGAAVIGSALVVVGLASLAFGDYARERKPLTVTVPVPAPVAAKYALPLAA